MLTVEKKIDSQLRISIPRNYFEKLKIGQGDKVLVSLNEKNGVISIYKEHKEQNGN